MSNLIICISLIYFITNLFISLWSLSRDDALIDLWWSKMLSRGSSPLLIYFANLSSGSWQILSYEMNACYIVLVIDPRTNSTRLKIIFDHRSVLLKVLQKFSFNKVLSLPAVFSQSELVDTYCKFWNIVGVGSSPYRPGCCNSWIESGTIYRDYLCILWLKGKIDKEKHG